MKKPKFSFTILASVISFSVHSADIQLIQNNQQISIDTDNLQISWHKKNQNLSINQATLAINDQPQHTIQLVQSSENQARWLLKPSNIEVAATFNESLNLAFTVNEKTIIKRNQPIKLTWFDLAEQATQTLVIPFNEGMRIPTDNKTWINYLSAEYSGSNTTQDLKMPFWTTEQNGQFVSYQFVTATNNTLHFTPSKQAGNILLDMQAAHFFTPLNRSQAFRVQISLGDEPLAGAKQYRKWRINHQQAQSLSTKRIDNPELKKLIGASHVYLFGRDVLAVEDVLDWWGLKDWYFNQPQFTPSKESMKELKSLHQGQDWLSKYHKRLLVESINQSINNTMPALDHPLGNNGIKEQYQAAQQRKAWLAIQARSYLISPDRWGQAISKDMITNLQKAGLKKLWLGLDNWIPAFYQPEIVEQAKKAGYLVGVYDSYNTAIAPGVNDAWLTAQLPQAMREECAIEKANGDQQKGFRGNGVYLNPSCHRDYVENRIKDVINYGRFNSIFLDVDATAMAREDYSDSSGEMNQTDMLAAFNARMQWIATDQRVLLGSEDGNALTTQGIAFAHGMETVGFGWTDPDMKSNRQSPYYLGAWYPDQKPAFFFQSAQVKEPYKTLLFAPQYRIPLYQTVFHDELINSHHWHSDSLKFSNVQIKRDLIAMLYNTPAMVHLSRDEANTINEPRLQALKHYQSGFLPIHKQLWDKALVNFKWLDKQGLLQQTTFSDGSKIIANFSKHAMPLTVPNTKHLPSGAILAVLSNGKTIQWRSSTKNND
ncbi:glycoside hydrolase [Photobacterium indicum]|uniref:glycoside hydrolase n=1 Tax=Photobacterium indicum TaxID=81447 RepID=UPI003D0D6005